METGFEAIVTFRESAVLLRVRDYQDLVQRTRQAIEQLPRSFVFVHKDVDRETRIDSDMQLQDLPHTEAVCLTVIESAVHRPHPPRVRLANLAYLKRQKPLKDPPQLEEVPFEERCPICMERFSRPMKAKCGHVCCLPCWEKALSHYLECPMCRGRVRLKTLRPV